MDFSCRIAVLDCNYVGVLVKLLRMVKYTGNRVSWQDCFILLNIHKLAFTHRTSRDSQKRLWNKDITLCLGLWILQTYQAAFHWTF